ncbi:nucleotide-diphospho-sugar transferase, partial [Decorospora gaudefroyi]
KNAYVTLLTRPSYLAGAILLAHTLTKHSPTTPLIITYTPATLPEACVDALRREALYSNIILWGVEGVRVPDGDEKGEAKGMVAERFADTWTKLRVFDLWEMPEKRDTLCWLDADMMIFSDPSPFIFNAGNEEYLSSRTDGEEKEDPFKIMAVHTCVCNLDNDAWAPQDWIPKNCALTYLSPTQAIAPVSPNPPTFSNFNSGTFVYKPSRALAHHIWSTFESLGPTRLRALPFPDQDFLNLVFERRWRALSWTVNALKTWRYWHPNFWTRDADVAVLHYIVDKPWAARVGRGGTAGYKGRDGVTHRWWWDEFEGWREERGRRGEEGLVGVVGRYVDGGEEMGGEDMRAVGGGAQDFAKKWVGGKAGEGKEEEQEEGKGERHAPVLRKPMLGERGHGPVVRGR